MTIGPLEIAAPLPPRGPFFKSQRLFIHLVCLRVDLPSDVAGKIADYLVGNENPFGAKEWKKYYGVDVGPEPTLPKEFYTFWVGPDPIDPTKSVWETHLPPVLRPEFVTAPSKTIRPSYNLKMLGLLIKKPQEGHRIQYRENSVALRQNENIKEGPACWLVLRKGVFDETRNQSYNRQVQFVRDLNLKTQSDYEEKVSVLDLATALCARHVFTGERHFGDVTGMENRETYSRCKEKQLSDNGYYPLVVGGFHRPELPVSAILDVASSFYYGKHDIIGVAGLRKFCDTGTGASWLGHNLQIIASSPALNCSDSNKVVATICWGVAAALPFSIACGRVWQVLLARIGLIEEQPIEENFEAMLGLSLFLAPICYSALDLLTSFFRPARV